jgi:predicted ATPase
MENSKIKIRNFGPIKEGNVASGWIEIKKVTVFIGNQGSGKSTVAKLISTLSWIEKALVRGELNESFFHTPGEFEKHCEYQNIEDYFQENTYIEYHGQAINFLFENRKTSIQLISSNEYYLPKIMYAPAERNFISAVRNIRNLKGLPGTLYTFSDEYFKAIENLKGNIELPINSVRFEYQKLNELASIVGDNFKIRLSHASSGFQSLVPLYIVSKFLAESINEEGNTLYGQNVQHSLDDDRKLKSQIQAIMNNPNYTEQVKQIQIELLSAKLKYSSFLNIVEEPEQNLFPTSQHKILNSLVAFNNMGNRNVLVMTTHSPYLINYLTLAVKAESLFEKALTQELKQEIDAIVPGDARINANDLIIYELSEGTGSISELKTYKGIPSDENALNVELGEFNELYSHMMDIQQRLQ